MTASDAAAGHAGGRGWRPGCAIALCEAWLGSQQRRLPLWLPVMFGAGAASYFMAGPEPDPGRWVAVLLAGGLVAAHGYRRGIWLIAAAGCAAAAFAAGLLAMQARAHAVATPTARLPIAGTMVEGRIITATRAAERGLTLTLAPARIDRWSGPLPRTIRLSVRGTPVDAVAAGRWIRVRASLLPPLGPAAPGAYDFARSAWFQGTGAVGYALGQPRPAEARPLTAIEDWAAALASMRWHITERIHAGLPGPQGAFAAALITGDRGALPDAEQQALRISGLQHVLSISGLHMALIGLGAFVLVRLALALMPAVAIRVPAKKWAAAAGFAAIAFYLLISGASVPAQRSFFMLGLVFVAIMLDREPLTMRLVAVAAMTILMATPEAVIDPSFQMSFAAAAAIVAIYERSRTGPGDGTAWPAAIAWLGAYTGGLMATSLIAGLATAPLTAYHFNTVSAYGVAANLFAMPVVGFVMMPAAAAAAIAMPVGLEAWPLAILGWTIDVVIAIAAWVSTWPGAVYALPAMPPAALALMALGGAWVILWQGRVRWAGLVMLPLGLGIGLQAPVPDIFVAGDGRNVAIHTAEGLGVARPERQAFTVAMWQARAGEGRTPRRPEQRPFRCDSGGCWAAFSVRGRPVSLLLAETRAAVRDDCGLADIIVSAEPAERLCRKGLVIGARALHRGGAHVITVTPEAFEVSTVADAGSRPWRPAPPPE